MKKRLHMQIYETQVWSNTHWSRVRNWFSGYCFFFSFVCCFFMFLFILGVPLGNLPRKKNLTHSSPGVCCSPGLVVVQLQHPPLPWSPGLVPSFLCNIEPVVFSIAQQYSRGGAEGSPWHDLPAASGFRPMDGDPTIFPLARAMPIAAPEFKTGSHPIGEVHLLCIHPSRQIRHVKGHPQVDQLTLRLELAGSSAQLLGLRLLVMQRLGLCLRFGRGLRP